MQKLDTSLKSVDNKHMICRKCNSKNLSDQNPFGFAVCSDCGWVSSSLVRPKSFRDVLKMVSKWFGLFCLVIFFAVMSIQLFVWKEFGFEATYLQVKDVISLSTQKDLLELGAICNTIGNYKRSAVYFERVVREDPNNRVALANLAISLVKMQEHKKSKPHFEAYFSLGGNAYDVMYWYGKVLQKLKGDEKAYPWFYSALSLKHDFFDAAQDLFVSLLRLNKKFEAAGVIGSFTKGQPYSDDFWSQQLFDYDLNAKNPDKVVLKLPSFDGRYHYAPSQFREDGRIYFVGISPKSSRSLIEEDVLFDNQVKVPQDVETKKIQTLQGPLEVKTLKLDYVKVGPWVFKNLEVNVCSGCQSVLGNDFLSQVNLDQNIKYQTQFLIMRNSKN